MQLVQLSVDDEIKSLGDSLKMLISDLVAKKPIAQVTGDVLPGLVAAISGYQAMGVDIKKVDNQAYLVKCLADALEKQ
jgi:hypothetical protein